MPDIDFDELDRAVHDLMRQSGQLPATPDKPSEAPAATPSKDSASSSAQQVTSPQQTTPVATPARPEVSDGTQSASTSSVQDNNTSTGSVQQADSPDTATPAKQSPALAPRDNTNSTNETVQTDDSTTATDTTFATDTNNTPARRRGVTIMPLSQQADEAEPAGESYEPVEPEPAVDRARALSESVVASEREPASIPTTPEQTDTDGTESAQVTPLNTATPAAPTTESVSSQSQPAAIVTVDPDDIITPASDDDDESDDTYTDRAQFFGRSAARTFFTPPRAATPADDVSSTTNSDASAPMAETDNIEPSAPSDRAVSDKTSATAVEEETPATIDQVESEMPTMPYQFAGEGAEGDDDDDDEALVRHLNEVNRTQDNATEPAQTSVVDDLDDTFAPQPLIIPPPTEEEGNTSLSSAETVVQPMNNTHTADDEASVIASQDEPDDTADTRGADDANDDRLLYASATPVNTDVPAASSGDDASNSDAAQPLDEPAWPELQYDEPDNMLGAQTPDADHTAPAWPEVAAENTSAVDDSQVSAPVADADVPSEHESFDGESNSWEEPTTMPAQPQAGNIASAESLTVERTMPDVAAANDSPSPQPEEALAEDALPEAHVDRPLPLLDTYNERRSRATEPYFSAPSSSETYRQEEANTDDVVDAAHSVNDAVQNTPAVQSSGTADSQVEQPYAPAPPLFTPADDVVAKAQQIIAADPEMPANDAPVSLQEEEDVSKSTSEAVPIALSQSADQQTKPSVASASPAHTADETASAEPDNDHPTTPAIQRPRGRFMDIVGGAAPVAAVTQAARPRVRRQGAVVEPLTSSAPVVGMDIRPAPGHEPAQHHAGAVQSTPPAGDEVKASDVVTPDGPPSAETLDLQPGDEKPLSYTPFLPDAETKVDKRPLGGADTLVGDAPTLADTVPMGMYHDESGALGVTPADNNEPSAPPHLFAPHDEHASAEQFIDALTDTSENAPSLYPTDDHYPLPEQDTREVATSHDELSYQVEDYDNADQSLYPDEQADSHAVSADGAGPQFAEDEIDLSLPVPGPGEPDIDYYGEAERVEAEPMTTATEWDDEPDTSDQAHVNTIEEAAATTQNGDTALALHQALQEENEGDVVAPIYSAEEFTRAPKKSRRRPEQAAGWIWLLWIVMLLALGAGLGAVYYTLFG